MASQRRHSQTHRQIFSGVHLGRSRFWVDENARGQRGGGRYGHQCEKGCHVFVVLGPLSQKTRVRGPSVARTEYSDSSLLCQTIPVSKLAGY
jgi:hypothetical protein